jgi:hypothetical protein
MAHYQTDLRALYPTETLRGINEVRRTDICVRMIAR